MTSKVEPPLTAILSTHKVMPSASVTIFHHDRLNHSIFYLTFHFSLPFYSKTWIFPDSKWNSRTFPWPWRNLFFLIYSNHARWKDPELKIAWVILSCSETKHFYFTVLLSNVEYVWILANHERKLREGLRRKSNPWMKPFESLQATVKLWYMTYNLSWKESVKEATVQW